MKKINKTLLLASTLFVSSALSLTDNAYANEGYNLDVEPATPSNVDNNFKEAQAAETLNQTSESLENSDNQSIQSVDSISNETQNPSDLPQENTTDQLPQDNSQPDLASEGEVSIKEETDQEDIVIYDDKNLDDALKALDRTPIEKKEEKATVEVSKDNKTATVKNTADQVVETETETEEIELVEKTYYAPKGTGVIVKENNNLKYYEDNKLVKNAQVIVNDKFYNIDNKGNATNPKALWGNIGSKIYYIDETGSILKGINEVNKKKYYFNGEGVLQRNKRIVTGEAYYDVNGAGEMIAPKSKWVDLNNKTYYNDNNGKLAKGISSINNKVYYFDEDGSLVRSKKILTDTKYYVVDSKGIVSNPKNLWFNMGGDVYKTNNDGNLEKGVRNINNKTYIFNGEGKMHANKNLIYAGKFYQIDKDGIASNPKNSWVELDGQKYHTNENGYVKEGVWKIDNEYYYFTSNGLTPNQVVTQKGVVYTVDEKGIATKQENNIPGEKSIDKVMEWMFNARSKGMTYNMGAGRNSATQADCSSAVYRALKHGGFLPADTWNGNTETLFQMGAKGKVMYEVTEGEIQHGDIFVAGRPGGSAGAAGHTGFILNPTDDTIIHMTSGKNGVAVTPRKGWMGDSRGLPVKYFRLVGANSADIYLNSK